LDQFKAFDATDRDTNRGEVKWRSFCAEMTATYLLGVKIGMTITGFERQSPRVKGAGKGRCDIAAVYQGEELFIEVKRKSGEELHSKPYEDTEKCPHIRSQFTPDSIDDIESYLLGVGKVGNDGKPMEPMVKKAVDKGADYLMCRISGWEALSAVIARCFKLAKAISRDALVYESNDYRLEGLRGVILFTEDELCVVNNHIMGGRIMQLGQRMAH
jgi:hypothetical protein